MFTCSRLVFVDCNSVFSSAASRCFLTTRNLRYVCISHFAAIVSTYILSCCPSPLPQLHPSSSLANQKLPGGECKMHFRQHTREGLSPHILKRFWRGLKLWYTRKYREINPAMTSLICLVWSNLARAWVSWQCKAPTLWLHGIYAPYLSISNSKLGILT